ncbi:hypothetical protein [Singulisphaera acidiphila]|uniref:Uncharacterized protein n=1 Tax=Singulisphaera acidiphila (strain ATCC BAA-1392 / DSM 18658 / VKM B-2454 / MOB10) TaxID=886293 RepID=L0D6M0_SINAD|nr:hypothetical protein [Singulisphaera acidiphila]AGA24478.1 hypothetical protein Sinac_0014 [Singulisphaera acidiphila DSM 18658]
MAFIAAELEGPITSITETGTGAEMVVLGMTIVIEKEAADNHKVRSPTNKRLTIAQLVDETSLRGLEEKGFVGGTAIVQGNFNTDTGKIEVKFNPKTPANQGANPFELHPAVEVGPPESLVSGMITRNLGSDLTVNNIPIKLLDMSDARFPGNPPRNEFGFDIKLDSVPPTLPASVDGYFSKLENGFIGYTFVVDGPATLTTDKPQVSITRAQGRNRGAEYDLNVRGGVTTSHAVGGLPQTLEIYRADAIGSNPSQETFLGRASARLIPGGFAKWSASLRITTLPAPFDVAPTRIVVKNVSSGAEGAFAREDDVEILKE